MRAAIGSVVLVLSMWLSPVIAAAAEPSDVLKALRFDEISVILSDEGSEYGEAIEEQMFPGRGGASWRALVDAIYAPDRLHDEMAATLNAELAGGPLDELLAFYQGDTGAKFVRLEEEARLAMMDEDVDQAARDTYAQMVVDEDARLDLLAQFIDVNGLVDRNVANTLNANFAFFQGLVEGGGAGRPLTEQDMLREVWSREDEIRGDTTEWVFSYLALAFAPASDAELDAYITFSQSDAGRQLNAALFVGFDTSFARVSREMGYAAAKFLASGEDI